MSWTDWAWRIGRTIGMVGFLVLSKAQPSVGADPEVGIGLRVYNFAGVPAETLNMAEMNASEILHELRLATRWIDCVPRPSAVQAHAECNEPLSSEDLVLRVLPLSSDSRRESPDPVLGTSMIAGNGERGVYASIYYQAVEYVARRQGLEVFQILSLAMTHEIGHLLSNSNTHSLIGIMKAEWSREDLRRAGRGQLLFTPQQSKLMRAGVVARRGKQDTSAAPVVPSSRSAVTLSKLQSESLAAGGSGAKLVPGRNE